MTNRSEQAKAALNADPAATAIPTDAERKAAEAWFGDLRDRICAAFEALEDEHTGPLQDRPAGRFERQSWTRTPGPTASAATSDPGGGTMAVMRGRVFEKVGVNISTVCGDLPDAFRGQIPGTQDAPRFFATGISLVAHLCSPHVPPVHMNTRLIITGKRWFGGGADLNPITPVDQDTADFHAAFKAACDGHAVADYERYRDWCNDYFYLPHRDEFRGVGGIFYDYLNSHDFSADFAFTRSVGEAFLDIYPRIVRRQLNAPWTEAERQHQLFRRGRYAEFNLLYDRGTVFGLKTGGNTEAILMSLPPLAAWP